MIRGYTAIALHNCKDRHNLGGVLRAAGCYGADLVVVGGKRRLRTMQSLSTDTQKAWKHIPTIQPEDVFDAMPLGALPIAVDLVPGARCMTTFSHPERAFYIFGPEDGTLSPDIIKRCAHAVSIPTAYCMNLAATVNVVLYDRLMKRAISDARLAA